MSDLLDLLSLADSKLAINMAASTTTHDVVLARHITAISRLVDDACGPVVVRTITAETHDVGYSQRKVFLLRRPVSSITTVREVRSGSVDTLAAVAFGAQTSGYFAPPDPRTPSLKAGVLDRRSSGTEYTWPEGDATVEVTYVAGRYATTAAVDARFADCAGAILRRLWKREAGSWAQASSFFEDADQQAGSGFFRVARPLIDEMLFDETQVQRIGIA